MVTVRSVKSWGFLLAVAVLPAVFGAPEPPYDVGGEPPSDEAQLYQLQLAIDEEVGYRRDGPKTYAEILMEHFGAERETLRSLRDEGLGWGEITILLAFADTLTRQDPNTYPSLDAGLQAVRSLKAKGEGWRRIGIDLDFPLRPVVRAAYGVPRDPPRAAASRDGRRPVPPEGSQPGRNGGPDIPENPN